MSTEDILLRTQAEEAEGDWLETEALRKELIADEDYCYGYAESFLNTWVASQIRIIRQDRGMTQQDLADAIGTKQTGISRFENINYSSWKTDTLRRIARALRVRLKISFEPFGSLLDDAAVLGPEALKRVPREEDPRLLHPEPKPLSSVDTASLWRLQVRRSFLEDVDHLGPETLEPVTQEEDPLPLCLLLATMSGGDTTSSHALEAWSQNVARFSSVRGESHTSPIPSSETHVIGETSYARTQN